MNASLRASVRHLRYPALAYLLLLSALTSGSRVLSQAGDTIGGFVLVSEQPQKGSQVLFTYRATLTNGGSALASATATATSLSSKTKIVDGTLAFGPVGAGGTVVSTDTFSLTRNPKQQFDWRDIVWTVATVPNHPPVANAGPDSTRRIGQTAQLDGSASSDQDGNALTYQWSLTSLPAGSQASLSDPAAVKPTFLVDLQGTYVATLIVSDGFVNSVADTVTVSTLNSAPVANAGADQTHVIHSNVTLNGSGSSDVDGDQLTYAWTFSSRPEGSAAVLVNPTSVTPSFQMERSGTYVVSLVVNDGFLPSDPDTVSITTLNSPPVANAGADQTAFVTNTVTLDGSGSTDIDGNPITYSWSLISVPSGSAAALDDATVPRPTFAIDRPGTYVAQLAVHDGTVASAPDTITVTTENTAPVANAGTAQTVVAGRVAVLDGGASSDVDGDPLTFRWSFTSIPSASAAVLANATTPTPSFTLDREGTFVVQLIVNDGVLDSAPATVTLTTTNSLPVANAGADVMNVLVATSVVLDGTQSADADEQPITYFWSLLARPETSTASLADTTSASPTLVPDVPGDYVAQLIVNDGFADSAPDTVLVRAVPVPVVTVAAVDHAAEPFLVAGLIRLTRSDSARPVTVSFAVGGTATNGIDFQLLGTTAFFDAGQSTVDLAIVPADDMLVEGPESVSATLVPGAEYAVGDPAIAEVTIADKPPIDLALVDTLLVGVGIPATLRVTLGAPASHGGATVTVTSDDPSILEVAAPGSLTIADGESAAEVVLSGLAPGAVTVRASAAHYQNGSLTVTVVRNIISLPSTFNASFGQPSSLPISIERDASNQGPVQIDVVSDDPSIISVSTPTITIPAGALTGSATIVGAAIGSTTLRATAASFVPDSGAGTVAAALDITAATLSIDTEVGATIAIELESPPGTPSAAPAGGVVVSLTSANPSCVSVPATATIAAGSSSVVANVSFGQTAVAPCATTVSATGPTGVTGDAISVTVNPAPFITAQAPGWIGGGLQNGPFTINLSAAQPQMVRVRVTSDDPSRVLVSSGAATAGSGAIDVDLPAGGTSGTFYVEGTDWVPQSSVAGAVTLRFSASGLTGGTTTVNYVQPALDIFGLETSTAAAGTNDDFVVRVGVAIGGSASLTDEQSRRAGASPLVATVSSSLFSVAEIDANGGGTGAAEGTANINAGQSSTPNDASGGLELDPKTSGTTVVTATIPGFITASAGQRTVTVATSPPLTLPAFLLTVGGGLQDGPFNVTLPATLQSSVIVHLVSNDPARILLAPNATAPGQAAIDLTIPSGSLSAPFHLQGVDWTASSSSRLDIDITARADGYADAVAKAAYVQPSLHFLNLLPTTTAISASRPFIVQVGIPIGASFSAQNRRPPTAAEQQAGIVPSLTATVTNGTSVVATLEKIPEPEGSPSSAQVQTVTIAPGTSNSPNGLPGGLRFDPVDAGTTVVTATIPGFITATQNVTVTAIAGINFPAVFGPVGGGLQVGPFTHSLGASEHGGVTLRLTSNDPTRVLIAQFVAPNTTLPGSGEIEIFLANGQQSFSYVLQATDWVTGSSSAAVTITARATGFTTANGTINYVQPAVGLIMPATTTNLSINSEVTVVVGVPGPGNQALSAQQNRRAGATPLVVTIDNSDETVAELDDDGGLNGRQEKTRNIVAGQATTPFGGLEFDPLSTGTTVVHASIPGFITTDAGNRTVTVVVPAITVPTTIGSVAGGLQTNSFTGSLGGTQHNGVTVRIVSSDSSLVLVAPNTATPGQAAIDIPVAAGGATFGFVVQGTDWIPGTSSTDTVTLTVTAPGFINDTSSVSYVQPAFDFSPMAATLPANSSNQELVVRVGIAGANNTAVVGTQARRAGAAPLTATITNSNDSVAEIDGNLGADVEPPYTVNINAGQSSTPTGAGGLELDPKAPGTTVVSVSIPGFIVTTGATKTVAITP